VLDEPPTNLDKSNVDSLSAAINKLIEDRRGHSPNPFQLIIISRDDYFVEKLREYRTIDQFYEIKKDTDGSRHYSSIYPRILQ
jgi:DNA repair exonuclease SbcCD ATPase subunit